MNGQSECAGKAGGGLGVPCKESPRPARPKRARRSPEFFVSSSPRRREKTRSKPSMPASPSGSSDDPDAQDVQNAGVTSKKNTPRRAKERRSAGGLASAGSGEKESKDELMCLWDGTRVRTVEEFWNYIDAIFFPKPLQNQLEQLRVDDVSGGDFDYVLGDSNPKPLSRTASGNSGTCITPKVTGVSDAKPKNEESDSKSKDTPTKPPSTFASDGRAVAMAPLGSGRDNALPGTDVSSTSDEIISTIVSTSKDKNAVVDALVSVSVGGFPVSTHDPPATIDNTPASVDDDGDPPPPVHITPASEEKQDVAPRDASAMKIEDETSRNGSDVARLAVLRAKLARVRSRNAKRRLALWGAVKARSGQATPRRDTEQMIKYRALESERMFRDSLSAHRFARDGVGSSVLLAAPLENEDDIICSICGGEDSSHARNNMIVRCDCCDLAVHQQCYGEHKLPEGPWFCDPCRNREFGALCAVCGNPNGAMKHTTDGRWVHVICALSFPELSFGSARDREPVLGVDKIKPDKFALKCFFCDENGCDVQPFVTKIRLRRLDSESGQAGFRTNPEMVRGEALPELRAAARAGACIQCSDRRCTVAFHPQCARERGVDIDMDSRRLRSIFCERHRRRNKRRSMITRTYREPMHTWNEKSKKLLLAPRKLASMPPVSALSSLSARCSAVGEWVPPLAHLVEHEVCQVCGCQDSWDENQLLRCAKCRIMVHQGCYGAVGIELSQGQRGALPWLCATCRPDSRHSTSAGIDASGFTQKADTRLDLLPAPRQLCCVICGLASKTPVPMQRAENGGWAHIVCALWASEIGFGRATTMAPVVGASGIYAARRFLRCFVCARSDAHAGACIQCSEPGCEASVHPLCAAAKGWLRMYAAPSKSQIWEITVSGAEAGAVPVYATPDNAQPAIGNLGNRDQVIVVARQKAWLKIRYSPTTAPGAAAPIESVGAAQSGIGAPIERAPSTGIAWVRRKVDGEYFLTPTRGQTPGQLLFAVLCPCHSGKVPTVTAARSRSDSDTGVKDTAFYVRWLPFQSTGGTPPLDRRESQPTRRVVDFERYDPTRHGKVSAFLNGNGGANGPGTPRGSPVPSPARRRGRKMLRVEAKAEEAVSDLLHKSLVKLQRTAVKLKRPSSAVGSRHGAWCYCQRPELADGTAMLQCDRCKDWFHTTCLGFSLEPKQKQRRARMSWDCALCDFELAKAEGVESNSILPRAPPALSAPPRRSPSARVEMRNGNIVIRMSNGDSRNGGRQRLRLTLDGFKVSFPPSILPKRVRKEVTAAVRGKVAVRKRKQRDRKERDRGGVKSQAGSLRITIPPKSRLQPPVLSPDRLAFESPGRERVKRRKRRRRSVANRSATSEAKFMRVQARASNGTRGIKSEKSNRHSFVGKNMFPEDSNSENEFDMRPAAGKRKHPSRMKPGPLSTRERKR